jgi:hypothetical protein
VREKGDERLRFYLLIPGILIALAGFVFILQGNGIVGPTSSFMYQSSTWIYYWIVFFLLGLLLIVGGLWKRRPKTSG